MKPTLNLAKPGQRSPTKNVAVDDFLLVRPGERIPADGMITEGSASINESVLTGESLPVDKKEGRFCICRHPGTGFRHPTAGHPTNREIAAFTNHPTGGRHTFPKTQPSSAWLIKRRHFCFFYHRCRSDHFHDQISVSTSPYHNPFSLLFQFWSSHAPAHWVWLRRLPWWSHWAGQRHAGLIVRNQQSLETSTGIKKLYLTRPAR